MLTPVFPEKILDAANSYLCLLDKWNSVHSLTALPQDERFEALLLDSAALLPHLETVAPDSLVADFGSGIGIPAVVIAAFRPDLRVAAIDRNHKKMAFVRQVSLELKLDNLRAMCGSVESMSPLGADIGTAKAVGSTDSLLRWWKLHSIAGSPFFAFKTPNWNPSEINSGWRHKIHQYQLPNLGKRLVVEFKTNL